MTTQRTYWHLEPFRKVPSEYEIGTTKLLYYPERGFEVQTPTGRWHQRHQTNSLVARDWERFRDPRETTYTRYVELQRDKEAFVDGLLRSVDAGYDGRLSPEWLRTLDACLPALRYPCHGLQMTAAFVGQMAPASRIVIGCLFQVGDEIRRIERFAYRMRELRERDPRFGERSKEAWQEAPEWQPLRKVVETLLVTYDFGEAFVALNLVLKPVFDRLVTVELARAAERNDDALLEKLLFSLGEDCAWHRDFSRALVRFAVEESADNRTAIETWVRRWREPVREAGSALLPLFGGPNATRETLEADALRLWDEAGIDGGTHVGAA